MSEATKVKGKQGFASMTPEQRREVAQRGGRAAHALGKAHKWSSASAREAGRKGRNSRRKEAHD